MPHSGRHEHRDRPAWRQVKDWKRALLRYLEPETEPSTYQTAYNLSTTNPYQGRNVVRLIGEVRQRDLAAAIFLTPGQAQRLGGHIPQDVQDSRVVFMRTLPPNATHEEQTVFVKRYGVYHYGDARGLKESRVRGRLAKIREKERLRHLDAAVRMYQGRYRPHADPPIRGDWPSDYFYRLHHTGKPFHALISSLVLCQEARVTFTWPVAAEACKEALRADPSTTGLRRKLLHWSLLGQ